MKSIENPSQAERTIFRLHTNVDLSNQLDILSRKKVSIYLQPTRLTTKSFLTLERVENPLSLAVKADENKWKVVNERKAINNCQYLSSIIGTLRTCEVSFDGSSWDHVRLFSGASSLGSLSGSFYITLDSLVEPQVMLVQATEKLAVDSLRALLLPFLFTSQVSCFQCVDSSSLIKKKNSIIVYTKFVSLYDLGRTRMVARYNYA